MIHPLAKLPVTKELLFNRNGYEEVVTQTEEKKKIDYKVTKVSSNVLRYYLVSFGALVIRTPITLIEILFF